MSAPKGANYIFLGISLVLAVNLPPQPATAPVFTIFQRLVSRPGDPHHATKFSLATPSNIPTK